MKVKWHIDTLIEKKLNDIRRARIKRPYGENVNHVFVLRKCSWLKSK